MRRPNNGARKMCDDFSDDWDDMGDDPFEPENDFEEDLCNEQTDEDFENLIDAQDEEQNSMGEEKQEGQVDFEDTMILGTMIAGSVYDEATKKRQLKKNKRNKK